MAEFAKKLKRMQENWETTKEKGYGDLPDGTFTFQVQDAKLTESEAGNLMIRVENLVIDGEQEGEVLNQFYSIETDFGLKQGMMWIEKMGRTVPEDAEEVEEIVAEIASAAPIFTARVRTNKSGFTNMVVQRLVEGETEGAPEPEKPKKGGKKGGKKEKDADPKVKFVEDDRVTVEIENETYAGKVTGYNKKGEVEVEFDDGDTGAYDEEDVIPEKKKKGGKKGGTKKGGKKKKDEVDLDELKTLAQAMGVEVGDEDDLDAVKTAINEYSWKKDQFEKEEIVMLTAIGADWD